MSKRTTLLLLAASPLIFVGGLYLHALVVSTMWDWFVAPTLHLEPLSLPFALGISLFFALVTHQIEPAETDLEDAWNGFTRAVIFAFGRPLVILLMGYAAHLMA